MDIFNDFLLEQLNNDNIGVQSTQSNYLLVHLYSSMLEASCGQMFLYPNAVYTTSMHRDKFDTSVFLLQVNDLLNYYPISFLETERDYKILVLIRRVLYRLYEHHGTKIRELYRRNEIAQFPVYSFFEQLIGQNGQTDQKKFDEESKLTDSVKVASTVKIPTKVQPMQNDQNDPMKLTPTFKPIVPMEPDEDIFDFEI